MGSQKGEECLRDELRTLFLFEHLSDEQLDMLCEDGAIETFPAGPLCVEGDPATCFYVMIDGELIMSKRSGGVDIQTNRTSQRGVYFGAWSAYVPGEEHIYEASVRLTKPSRCFVLDANAFAKFMQTEFPMAVHLLEGHKVGGRRQITHGLQGYGKAYKGYQNGSIQLEPSTRNVDSVALEANVDLGFATLTSSSSWYDHEGDSVSENTGFYAKAGFLAFYYNYPRPMASAVRGYRDKSFVQELRLVSKGGAPLDYVVGAYYQDQKLFSSQDSFLRGFKRWWDTALPAFADAVAGDQDFFYRRHETFKDRALFGELTWHATDTVDLTGGVRYFWNKAHNDTSIDIPIFPSLSQPTDATFRTSEDKALFKGNLSWKFADRGLLYATVSQGYRRGGSNAVPTIGRYAEDPSWQQYKSDTLINYEVGVKGVLGGLTYNLDAFYIDWKDIQLNTATPVWGFYVVQNGGKARSQGIEAQVEGRSGGLHYALGYTYVDAKLTRDFFSPDPSHVLIGRDGDRLPGSAHHIVTGSADYSIDLGGDTSLTLRGDGFSQSSTRNAISTSPKFNVRLPGFSIWNASATLRKGSYGLTLFVKNLFNADGVTGVFTEAYMGTSPSQGYYGNGSKDLITLPRTIGLSADVRF